MTWFRLDDTWLMHPKVQAAGLRGRALWVAGGLHCAQQLTDGRIDKTLVAVLAAQAGVTARDARVLVDVGLWDDGGDHWVMHDWSQYQPSREQVTADRAAAAERQKRARERARDKARESQEKSRRDSRVSNGVSHGPPDPTRPDPNEKEAARDPEMPANELLLHEAQGVIEARRDLVAESLTKDNPGGWLATTRQAIEDDLIQAMAAWWVDRHAIPTATELADQIHPARPAPSVTPARPVVPLRSAPCDCGECDGRGNVFDDAGEFIERHDPRPPTTTDQEQPA